MMTTSLLFSSCICSKCVHIYKCTVPQTQNMSIGKRISENVMHPSINIGAKEKLHHKFVFTIINNSIISTFLHPHPRRILIIYTYFCHTNFFFFFFYAWLNSSFLYIWRFYWDDSLNMNLSKLNLCEYYFSVVENKFKWSEIVDDIWCGCGLILLHVSMHDSGQKNREDDIWSWNNKQPHTNISTFCR